MSFDSGKAPPDELDLLVGSTVAGKYHIDRLIGRGGMGAVFQATNAAIGKRVALKFLGASASRDSEAATRFQREAQAASLAESPHIVQIFDAGKSERGLPFLVMELLTGEDLRARLRREGRLDADSAVRIAIDVLKALKQAHAAGIVHRDLKPDNVFLCRRDGEPSFVKLVDFGISKLQRRRDVDTITHEGAVLGTAFYMSPEQAQSFPDIDGRTDLFALGAILYEMLCGVPPHSAPTYEAVLIAICTRDAEDVRLKAPNVPPALARVIQKALSRKREERYQSADEMLAEIERARALAEQPAESSRSERGASPDRASGKRFQTLVFALVAALGGFAVAAYLVTHGGAAAEPEPLALPPRTPVPTASAQGPAPREPATAVTSPPSSTPPSVAKVTITKSQDPKPPPRKPPPAGSAGVAGGLGLSTREP